MAGASLVAQLAKNPRAMQEMQAPFLTIHWRRERLPIPVFLPGKFHGQRTLAVHSSWGREESSMTEHRHTHTHKMVDINFVMFHIFGSKVQNFLRSGL